MRTKDEPRKNGSV